MKLHKNGRILKILLLTAITLLYGGSDAFAEKFPRNPTVYYSWDVFEPDKCAAIWLLKRFVEPCARVQIVPKGKTVPNAIPFDIPMAKFRRYHNKSTFETMLEHFHLRDTKLIHMGKIIHDIEINIWEKKRMPETWKVQEDLARIISGSATNEEIIEKSYIYFDELYKCISENNYNAGTGSVE